MLEIIPYTDDRKHYIKLLNQEWLLKYFSIEPNDEIQLSDPKGEIIDKGGFIYYASIDSQVVGVVALMRIDDHTFELSKMAVAESCQGQGIGIALMEHCIITARSKGITKLILYSNTILKTAIGIYYKYGFQKIDFDSTHYKRANIKMQLDL